MIVRGVEGKSHSCNKRLKLLLALDLKGRDLEEMRLVRDELLKLEKEEEG